MKVSLPARKEKKRKIMSISEDEKLSQMIMDYIEFGSAVKTDSFLFHPSSQSLHLDDNPSYFFLEEILEETPDAETEVYAKILFYLKDKESSMTMDNNISKLKNWIVYRFEMDNYEAHLCRTSWSTPFGPPSVFQFRGDYEYVEVMIKDRSKEVMSRLIVDIDFRTQFEVARPTQAYQELTNALPLIFVGTEDKLKKLVSLICTAAKQSLKEKGLHIPPWRKATYMHSKWLSQNCKRVPFSQIMNLHHHHSSYNI
ncbi:uncharacterized protein LOC127265302 [Andrographis paniculata]|uniref:uncharacterized protein LOC127265302 n=1 Tax=Andrographis paniculata TaxID=175694 RepID=UPI0021E7E213|nr:uncharacterized protein LOC127265302 [Andrographis paniculata]